MDESTMATESRVRAVLTAAHTDPALGLPTRPGLVRDVQQAVRRRRAGYAVMSAVAVSAVALTAPVAVNTLAGQSDTKSSSASSSERSFESMKPLDQLQYVRRKLEAVGRSDPAFTAAVVEDASLLPPFKTVFVYRTRPGDPAAEKEYRRQLPAIKDWKVQFKTAQLSRREIDRLYEIWRVKKGWLAAHGVIASCAMDAGPAGGYRFQMCNTGSNQKPSSALLEPFLIFGPRTASFLAGDISPG